MSTDCCQHVIGAADVRQKLETDMNLHRVSCHKYLQDNVEMKQGSQQSRLVCIGSCASTRRKTSKEARQAGMTDLHKHNKSADTAQALSTRQLGFVCR